MITSDIDLDRVADQARATFADADLIDEIWAHLHITDLSGEQCQRIARRAIEILSTPTDAELEDQVGWVLYLALAVGLVALIGYALVGDPLMAWGGAGAFTFAAVVYGWYLMVTEPNA